MIVMNHMVPPPSSPGNQSRLRKGKGGQRWSLQARPYAYPGRR